MSEIETLKLTLRQLNERIAGLRGWHFNGDEGHWVDGDNIQYRYFGVPDYTGDMNMATELFWDLPGGMISGNCIIWNCLNCTKQHQKDDLAVAICLAWLQYETGEVVELTQD